jgi:predicted Zn-dependent peptidase
MSGPAGAPASVPALGEAAPATQLPIEEQVLDSGLRVIAVRKPGVPLVEMRLRIPTMSPVREHGAGLMLMGETLLTGAGGRDRVALASAIGELGADVSVGLDADRAVLSASVLAPNLGPLLDIAASVLVEPAYPEAEIEAERARLLERLAIARSQAAVVAREARAARMFAGHPYGHALPGDEEVRAVAAGQIRALHDQLLRPAEAILVLVGDIEARRAFDIAAASLGGWAGRAGAPRFAAPGPAPRGPLGLVDRPGSVQSSLRLGAAAIRRDAPGYPALLLANMIFGGYFSSRWNENLREDKGYTYGPHSRIEHDAAASSLLLDADVRTEVTAPALLETLYELGRISALPVAEAEVDSARQYAIGSFALSLATQAGLATTLSALVGGGLSPQYLHEHPARLAAVAPDEVSEAAREFFAPTRFLAVVVGDDGAVRPGLERLVDTAPADGSPAHTAPADGSPAHTAPAHTAPPAAAPPTGEAP